MTICATPLELIKTVFKTFPPDSVEELELSTNWTLAKLSCFAPCLGQMRNLCELHLAQIYMNTNKGLNSLSERKDKCASRFISQISKLTCLQPLSMNGVVFPSELLKHFCSCLSSPLESLSIKLCQLSESELKHLSQCQRLFQLKQLNLCSGPLFNLSPTHLQFLLEKVADTLQARKLENCRMRESLLSALMPALNQGSKLNRVNFYDNGISKSLLMDLLDNMDNLRMLTEEFYPVPLECYDKMGHIQVDKFANLCPDLLYILRSNRHPKKVSFQTEICQICFQHCVYDLKTGLCHCHKQV
ncbi:PRAME family member 6 [Lemmus lemmus]